jgi:hypothetical protein
MKCVYILISLMISFNSFAFGDFSCLKNSTFTIAKNADGSANAVDLKGQIKIDLMAEGRYAFISGSGPNYLFQGREFYVVLRYDQFEDVFISVDGKFSIDVFCKQKELSLQLEDDTSKIMTLMQLN